MPQQTAKFTLLRGDRVDGNTDYRDALPVNMYAVKKPILGADGYMICYPGLTQHATGKGVDRGGFFNDRFDKQYRVSGTKLIEINSAGAVTELGTVPGTSQAAMDYSFNTQCVVADGKMFLYDSTNGFVEVTDPDLGSPLDVVWTNGRYFLTDGEYIYHTDLNDEAAIDPLKFATAEFMPDDSVGVAKTSDNKVVVFGRYTIEYFVDAANDNFAYTRVESRAQKIGIVATHAKCEHAGNFYIVGGRREESLGVYLVGVGQSVKVSSREVDKVLAGYNESELADIRVECRTEDDTTFILIHLPNECLCFNASIAESTGVDLAWFYLRTGYEGEVKHRAINGVFDSNIGKWVYGDKVDTCIGVLDNTVFTQYGEQQEWYLYTPLVNLETMSVDEISIETIPGHTTTEDAKVAVSITNDGYIFGNEEWVMYGDPLDYNKRFSLYRLGYVDDWVGFRMRAVTKSRMAFGLMTLIYG